jgi:squalene synthase HpnC
MASPTTPPAANAPLSGQVAHYENFPVASWLCPRHLRPAIVAIYHFARTADDMADEGNAPAQERLAELVAYRAALNACLAGAPPQAPWKGIFVPLSHAVAEHALPTNLLHDLLSAFEQDIQYTASGHRYADTAELLEYCRLSANPVGRLLLHLYGVNDATSLQQSDQICSALQLINFWQDISVDMPRNRVYLPTDSLQRHGVQPQDFLWPNATQSNQSAQQAVVTELCAHARQLMQSGASLPRRVPGRAGWELRLVVQGGLRILDAIAAVEHRSWQSRPKLGKADVPRMLWRALWM